MTHYKLQQSRYYIDLTPIYQKRCEHLQEANKNNYKIIIKAIAQMQDCSTQIKRSFFNQPLTAVQNLLRSSSIHRQVHKSETQLTNKKIESNKTQVFPKQYTNKYFRNSSLYEQQQNQKLSQLSRFYSFMRKTKMTKKFKQKKILTCNTQPNQQLLQNHQKSFHILNELKFRSIRNKKYSNKENKIGALKQINVNNIDSINISKQKISTSRALQKYARLIKEEIFHSSKSHIFDRSPIRRERSQLYKGNIQTKKLMLCTKNLKNDTNLSKQFIRSVKNHLTKQKGKTISSFSNDLNEQNFDINGWETSS